MTTPPPGDGRNQVVDLSVIDTDWGNAVSDRTLQSYPSVADRDALWPHPRPGSMCYTALDDEYWVTRGGKWVRMPTGYVGGIRGPADNFNSVSGQSTEILRYDFPVKVGHNYLVTTYVNCFLQNRDSATAGALWEDDQGTSSWLSYSSGLPNGWSLVGSAPYYYNPSSTKTAWVKLKLYCFHTPGWLRTGQNWNYIQVADVG